VSVPVRWGGLVISSLSSWRPEALPLPDGEELDVTESDPDDVVVGNEDAFLGVLFFFLAIVQAAHE
jgi:hypothetical protein